MADDRDLVLKLVQTLRRIEADAEGALQHRGELRKTLQRIRDDAGEVAAEAAKAIGLAPYAIDKSS